MRQTYLTLLLLAYRQTITTFFYLKMWKEGKISNFQFPIFKQQ